MHLQPSDSPSPDFPNDDPPEPLTSFRPLPDEILRMSEEETACQYCGISYLLLTKYERMANHVRGLEEQLEDHKKYAIERPGLLKRIETMIESQRKSSETASALQTQLRASQEEARIALRELEDLKGREGRLTDELESVLKKSTKNEETRKRQLATLFRRLNDIRTELLRTKSDVESSKSEFQSNLTTLTTATIPSLRSQITNHINVVYKQQTNDQLESLRAVEGKAREEVEGVRRELVGVRGALRESLENNRELSQKLSMQRQESVGELDAKRAETDVLQSRITSLESQVNDSTAHIIELTKERDALHQTRRDLEHRFEEQREQVKRDVGVMETHVIGLSEKLTLKEKELQDLQSRMHQERRNSENGSTALGNMSKAMAAKDIRTDRQKTVEAHQNRIRQLQDKFVEDLKEAGRVEADRREVLVRDEMRREAEERCREVRRGCEMELNHLKSHFQTKMDALQASKTQLELTCDRRIGALEVEWSRKCEVLSEQMKKMK
ncbi:hypothetical protein HK097_002890, partial [Rhizophlyctis rosea]